MTELTILYHLCILVGFLLAGFLAMLIGAAVLGLRHWCKSSIKELEDLIDQMETEERKSPDESHNT